MGKIIDKVKEKTKNVKDKVVDTTKDVADKTKDTGNSRTSETSADPLTEYKENEPMTPAKIKEHEPTAVKRDPSDQKITEQGKTGTDTEQANEQYRKRGMAKADSSES